MVYKGTTVVAGQATAVVTATGALTEVGRIGVLTSGIEPEPTPLERKLDVLGRRLVWITLVIAGARRRPGPAARTAGSLVLETAIALAVAAVPEALPAVATIALAIGMHRMARRHALVRRLPAVEALGATTVVCTDKTRTLTSGQMRVVRIWTPARSVARAGWRETSPALDPRDAATCSVTAALASRGAAARRRGAGRGSRRRRDCRGRVDCTAARSTTCTSARRRSACRRFRASASGSRVFRTVRRGRRRLRQGSAGRRARLVRPLDGRTARAARRTRRSWR